MEFETRIEEYKKNENTISSPIWIWFVKSENGAKCDICKTTIPQRNGSTGGMVNHLKRHHGHMTKINAWKEFEQLSTLKEKRLMKKRKPNRRQSA